MGKHAYLIMAHNQFDVLEKLVQLLDYPDNDIYIHVDKKVVGFSEEQLRQGMKHSKLVFFPSMHVNWGGYSQIACEMMMFTYMTEQVSEKYQYYHFISGVDLPLKSQKEIHEFFDKHNGEEFVIMGNSDTDAEEFAYRVKYYYPFQERIGKVRAKGKKTIFYEILASGYVRLQKLLGVNRSKGRKVYMGPNWLNITYDCMKYIVSKKKDVEKYYRKTTCGDEIFVQSLLADSPFREKINREPLRFIDWNRGTPYVFRKEDYEELMDSPCLWGRKFDSRVDNEIINRIFDTLKNET